MQSAGLRRVAKGSSMLRMGEDIPRGDNVATNRDTTGPSGWVTTQVAAKALDISPRTVRWHIEQGNLEAKPQGEGVRRSWLVSIDSLQTLRDKRQRGRDLPGYYRDPAKDADIAAENPGNPIRELADRLVEEASKAAEFRVRLELSEQAESTLREELAEERRRREEAEREREGLRRELDALRETRESPESPGPTEEALTPGYARKATVPPERQESARPRSLWSRIFGQRS